MIGLNYTPVIQKRTPVKRRGRFKRLEQKDTANAFSHDATKELPAKKRKTSGPRLELPHSTQTVTSNVTRDGQDGRRTAKMLARVSVISSDTRKGGKLRGKSHSLFSYSMRQWTRRRRRRKRFALHLKKRDGEIKKNPQLLMPAL